MRRLSAKTVERDSEPDIVLLNLLCRGEMRPETGE